MFNKETYIQRRNRLKKEIGKGILLFLGNNESGMNYADNTYHFRQDSTFLYFFGSDYAGLSALIDIDECKAVTISNLFQFFHNKSKQLCLFPPSQKTDRQKMPLSTVPSQNFHLQNKYHFLHCLYETKSALFQPVENQHC